MRIHGTAFTLLFALATLGGNAATAQDATLKLMIDKVTCREVLKMGGDERDFTLVFLHGFMSGKQNMLEFDGPALTEATDKVLDACIASPDDTVLSVFEKVRG